MQKGIAKPSIWFSQWLFLYLNIYDMYIIYKINIIDNFSIICLYIYTFFDEYFKTEEKNVFTNDFLYIGGQDGLFLHWVEYFAGTYGWSTNKYDNSWFKKNVF